MPASQQQPQQKNSGVDDANNHAHNSLQTSGGCGSAGGSVVTQALWLTLGGLVSDCLAEELTQSQRPRAAVIGAAVTSKATAATCTAPTWTLTVLVELPTALAFLNANTAASDSTPWSRRKNSGSINNNGAQYQHQQQQQSANHRATSMIGRCWRVGRQSRWFLPAPPLAHL